MSTSTTQDGSITISQATSPEGPGESAAAPAFTGPVLEPDISRQWVEVVDSYRAGQISKARAMSKIHGIIPGNADDEDSFFVAYESYQQMLDSIDWFTKDAGERGRRILAGAVGAGAGEASGSGKEDVVAGTPKRARSSSVASDRTADEATNKKSKLDFASLPWVERDELDPPNLCESLRKTQSILENFSRDIKSAKSSLLNSSRRPQFPESEWGNLLAGKAVDLDHVTSP